MTHGLARLLPGVAVAEQLGAPIDPPLAGGADDGSGSEAAAVAGAVAARRREFATGRDCARRALATLDPAWRDLALPPDSDRVPRWPAGVVASITHTDGYCAAAAAWSADLAGVGIDAEPDEPLPVGVLELVASGPEIDALRGLAGVAADRLLFCAKEAAFKAWFPATRVWLEPAAVRAHLTRTSADAGTFSVENIAGRWLLMDGLLLAAATIPAPHAATRRART